MMREFKQLEEVAMLVNPVVGHVDTNTLTAKDKKGIVVKELNQVKMRQQN